MDTQILSDLKNLQEKLRTTSSSLAKQKILKDYVTSDLKRLFQLVYDTDVIFNITSKKIYKIENAETPDNDYNLFELLNVLTARIITGNLAAHVVQNYIKKYPEFEETILNIIDKDLKVGVNVRQIIKIFPDLINVFSVALAEKFDDKSEKLVKMGSWFISQKLDGVRCICIIKNGDVRFYFRSGKEIFTLKKVGEEIKKLGVDNIVFDGEVAKVNENGQEDFQGIMKEIRRKDYTIEKLRYFIFDTLTLDEFNKGISKRKFSNRLEEQPKIKTNHILTYLPQYPYSLEKLVELQKTVSEKNWEGLMLRKDVGYNGKRSKDILKVKKFFDDEFIVTGTEMNNIRQYNKDKNNYDYVETLGAVIIDYKGHPVSVGSGFSMEERNEYYKNPEKIVGKLITVQYFEEIKDKNGKLSLRFPTFKLLVGDKRET